MKSSSSIKKGLLTSRVNLPSSKSYANRALIIAAVSNSSPTLVNLPEATDVTNLLACFRSIGLNIESGNQSFKITNSFPACETSGKTLDVGDGGTTARFLAAMLLLGKETYKLKLGKRLKDRPWQEFIDIVKLLGGKAELLEDQLIIKGPVKFPDSLEIDCSKTTQFATAFQLIAGNTKIIPMNLKSSASYWQMTEQLMATMKKAERFSIPLDWSSASYPLAFGALNQTIEFPGLKYDSYQADSKFMEILKGFGAIEASPDGSVIVKKYNKLSSLNYDVSDALDLVPALAFFLAHIPGHHQLTGIKNLIHKESNRLAEVIRLLALFEKESSTDGEILHITGTDKVVNHALDLNLVDDHRMVMTGTLFLLHHAGGTIHPAHAVDKSYPGFFNLIDSQN